MRLLVHPLFLVVAAVAIFYAATYFFLALLVSSILHEFGHWLVARHFGVLADRLSLTPFGCAIKIKTKILTRRQQCLIYLAGPMTSLLFTLIFGVLVWLFPVLFGCLEYLVAANFLVGIMNLVPIYPLDGGKIVANFVRPKIVLIWSNIVLAVILLFGLIFFNIGVIFFAVMVLLQINWEYRATTFYDKFTYRGGQKTGAFHKCAVLSGTTLLAAYQMIHPKRPTEFIVTDCQNRVIYESDLERWLLQKSLATPLRACLDT